MDVAHDEINNNGKIDDEKRVSQGEPKANPRQKSLFTNYLLKH